MKIKCDIVNGCEYLTAGKEYTVLDEHPRSYSNPEQRYLDILTDTGLRITVLLKDCPHIQANWCVVEDEITDIGKVTQPEGHWSNWIKNNQKDPNINNIEVYFRDGDRDSGDSKEYYWGIDGDDSDLVAYRYKIQERDMQSMAEEMTAVSAELSSYMTKEEEELFKEEEEVEETQYSKYFKDFSQVDEADVYRVHYAFNIEDPSGCIHHASKKLLLSGVRTGGKSKFKDVQEARDTLNRWLEINSVSGE